MLMTEQAIYSLRHRLLRRSFTLLAGVFLVLLVGGWQFSARVADLSYDRLLNSASLSLLERIGVANESLTVSLPYAALAILELAPDERIFYRVVRADGTQLTGYQDLPLPPHFVPSEQPRFYDARYRGEAVRLVVQSKLMSNSAVSGWVNVIVAQTRHNRTVLAHDLLLGIVVPLLLILLLALFLLRVGIKRTIAPVVELSRQLRAKDEHDFQPLQAPVHEVVPLVEAINDSRRRLQLNLDQMRDFIADASHQIRTAMSQTQAQIDMADSETEIGPLRERLGRIRREHESLIRLTSQLLAHAQVVHRRDALPLECFDLDALMREVIARFVRQTVHSEIEFSYHCDNNMPVVCGDRISLREALVNLLDNAIKYGPDNNHIDIAVHAVEAGVDVIIDDAGPGIPESEHQRLLQRFQRLHSDTGGSGLGLAIVSEVAELHHGRLQLSRSPEAGLRVVLHLPVKREVAHA